MNTIKLYHISYDLSEPLDKKFIPKIPSNPATGEDESIPRICLCDSIEGCINAAEDKLGNYEDTDIATIIVWEKEFSLLDDKLICWQQLYEDDLVPDAALTHEYWYLEPLHMKGSLYKILNVNDAISNKKIVYIIKPKYKEKVLYILADYGINLDGIKNIDLYTLINEWLPSVLPEKLDVIIEKLMEEIRVIDNADIDYSIFDIVDTNSKQNTILDMDYQRIYYNLVIRKDS